MGKLLSLLFFAAVSFSCTGDERPPPSSPHDPASPRAAETPFDAGTDPFGSPPVPAPSQPMHQHGGAH